MNKIYAINHYSFIDRIVIKKRKEMCDIINKELFDNEILHFFDIKKLEGDTKLNFVKNVNHNIQHYYYMDMETRFENNFLPFDENNNLILPENFYCKN